MLPAADVSAVRAAMGSTVTVYVVDG